MWRDFKYLIRNRLICVQIGRHQLHIFSMQIKKVGSYVQLHQATPSCNCLCTEQYLHLYISVNSDLQLFVTLQYIVPKRPDMDKVFRFCSKSVEPTASDCF